MSAKDKTLFFIPGFMGEPKDSEFLKNSFKEVQSFNYFDYGASSVLEGLCQQIQEKRPDVIYTYSMGGRLLLELYCAGKLSFKPQYIILESVALDYLDGTFRKERLNSDIKRSQDIVSSFGDFIRKWYRMPMWNFSKNDYQKMVDQKLSLSQYKTHLSEILIHFSPGNFPKENDLKIKPKDIVKHDGRFLYFAGAQDSKYAQVAGELMACDPANAHIIKGAGHNIHFQKPEDIIRLIEDSII